MKDLILPFLLAMPFALQSQSSTEKGTTFREQLIVLMKNGSKKNVPFNDDIKMELYGSKDTQMILFYFYSKEHFFKVLEGDSISVHFDNGDKIALKNSLNQISTLASTLHSLLWGDDKEPLLWVVYFGALINLDQLKILSKNKIKQMDFGYTRKVIIPPIERVKETEVMIEGKIYPINQEILNSYSDKIVNEIGPINQFDYIIQRPAEKNVEKITQAFDKFSKKIEKMD